MFRQLLISIIVSTVSGCVTGKQSLPLEYRECPMVEVEAWAIMQHPPNESSTLLAISNPNLVPPSPEDAIRLFWFEATNGHVLLCRAVISTGANQPPYGCAATSWEFKHENGEWTIVNSGVSIMFCG